MRTFIKLWGEAIQLDSTGITHEDYAYNVKHLPLKTMLEDHARVHVHNKHFVLETNQTHLTVAQKRRAGKLFKENNCIAWTIQIDGEYCTSDPHECVTRINWGKFN